MSLMVETSLASSVLGGVLLVLGGHKGRILLGGLRSVCFAMIGLILVRSLPLPPLV